MGHRQCRAALASIQRRLDCLTVFEYADSSSRNSPEMLCEMMGFGTANRPVNAVSYVCEAPPGFQTAIDLPQIMAKLG
jgi:4-hydroxy-tetrahydrodipicolinate reductase